MHPLLANDPPRHRQEVAIYVSFEQAGLGDRILLSVFLQLGERTASIKLKVQETRQMRKKMNLRMIT